MKLVRLAVNLEVRIYTFKHKTDSAEAVFVCVKHLQLN
jgi:hypothetical protein